MSPSKHMLNAALRVGALISLLGLLFNLVRLPSVLQDPTVGFDRSEWKFVRSEQLCQLDQSLFSTVTYGICCVACLRSLTRRQFWLRSRAVEFVSGGFLLYVLSFVFLEATHWRVLGGWRDTFIPSGDLFSFVDDFYMPLNWISGFLLRPISRCLLYYELFFKYA